MSESKSIKVSIVIPFYNEKNYIDQALNSIQIQTLKDIEIICVSDGSTDGSIEIVKKHQQADSRIQLYERPHSSAGAARNYGMEKAVGKYIIFLDGDDYFDSNMLEKLYDKAEKDSSDICIFDSRVLIQETGEIILNQENLNASLLPEKLPFNKDTAVAIFNFAIPAPWTKFYNREFIKKSDLQFMDIPKENDIFFVLTSLVLAQSITVLQEKLMTYRKHSGSLQRLQTINRYTFAEALIEIQKRLKKENLYSGNIENSFLNFALGITNYNLEKIKVQKRRKELFIYTKKQLFKTLEIKDYLNFTPLPGNEHLLRLCKIILKHNYFVWLAFYIASKSLKIMRILFTKGPIVFIKKIINKFKKGW
ncbi:MAG: glycosyltransferase [Treponema sp.]|nr:glycosyltransferase [Treponema sp.]